jgi:hypothetical protein
LFASHDATPLFEKSVSPMSEPKTTNLKQGPPQQTCITVTKIRESTIHAASVRILKEDVRIINAGVETWNHLFSDSSEEGWLKALFRHLLQYRKKIFLSNKMPQMNFITSVSIPLNTILIMKKAKR